MTHSPHPDRPTTPSALSSRIARLTDDLVTVPGTTVGVGLDAVIGLIPGIGDLLGSTLSSVIFIDAVRLRVPVRVLLRMAWNVIVDALLGLVPFIGDLADVAHRANRRNLRLLEASLVTDQRSPLAAGPYLLTAIGLFLASIGLALGLAVLGLWLLWRVIVG